MQNEEPQLTREAKEAIRGYLVKIVAIPMVLVTIALAYLSQVGGLARYNQQIDAQTKAMEKSVDSISTATVKEVSETIAEVTKVSLQKAHEVQDEALKMAASVAARQKDADAVIEQGRAAAASLISEQDKIQGIKNITDPDVMLNRLLADPVRAEKLARALNTAAVQSLARWGEPKLLGRLERGKENVLPAAGVEADGLAYVSVGGDQNGSDASLWIGDDPKGSGNDGRRVHVKDFESAYFPVRRGEKVRGSKNVDSGVAEVFFIPFASASQ